MHQRPAWLKNLAGVDEDELESPVADLGAPLLLGYSPSSVLDQHDPARVESYLKESSSTAVVVPHAVEVVACENNTEECRRSEPPTTAKKGGRSKISPLP